MRRSLLHIQRRQIEIELNRLAFFCFSFFLSMCSVSISKSDKCAVERARRICVIKCNLLKNRFVYDVVVMMPRAHIQSIQTRIAHSDTLQKITILAYITRKKPFPFIRIYAEFALVRFPVAAAKLCEIVNKHVCGPSGWCVRCAHRIILQTQTKLFFLCKMQYYMRLIIICLWSREFFAFSCFIRFLSLLCSANGVRRLNKRYLKAK